MIRRRPMQPDPDQRRRGHDRQRIERLAAPPVHEQRRHCRRDIAEGLSATFADRPGYQDSLLTHIGKTPYAKVTGLSDVSGLSGVRRRRPSSVTS